MPTIDIVQPDHRPDLRPLQAGNGSSAAAIGAPRRPPNQVLLEVADCISIDRRERRAGPAADRRQAAIARLRRARRASRATARRGAATSFIEVEVWEGRGGRGRDLRPAGPSPPSRPHRPARSGRAGRRARDPDRPQVRHPGLVEAAQRQRPDVAARDAEVGAAEVRQRQEQYRPFLPTLATGWPASSAATAAFLGRRTGQHRGRTGFDVLLFWTLQGTSAQGTWPRSAVGGEQGQAVAERSRVLAEARAEVAAAAGQVGRDALTQIEHHHGSAPQSAERGFAEDLDGIRNVVGRPVEVVRTTWAALNGLGSPARPW
ncbi:MAG: hypothetical protein U0835_23240 [Isosphaeraceae bacterium]